MPTRAPRPRTADEEVELTRQQLSSSAGRAEVERVIGYFNELDEVASELKRAPLGKRPWVDFFATTGNFRSGKRVIDVRIHGRNVGRVSLQAGGDRRFTPTLDGLDNSWRAEWRAPQVRHYLTRAAQLIGVPNREAMVQSGTFVAMAIKRAAAKLPSLRRAQPVLFCGLPFQFPLPIAASGTEPRVGPGHADVLVRHANGRIRVIELKRPGVAGQPLAQGIRYATALAVLFEREPRALLKMLGMSPRRRTLRLDVAAFVDESMREAVVSEAHHLSVANHHFDLTGMFYRLDGARLAEVRVEPLALRTPRGS